MLSRFAPHNTLRADIDGARVRARTGCRDRVLLSRAGTVTRWLGEVARRHPTLRGTWLVCLEDGTNYGRDPDFPEPEGRLLAFGVPTDVPTSVRCIPDPYFVQGYGALVAEVEAARGRPKPHRAAVWRGSTTGPDWQASPRRAICLASLRDPDVLDARATALVQGAQLPEELLAPRMSIAEQLGYRVLLHADGNAAAWDSTYWRLLSDSLVVWYRPQWTVWCNPVPWEHYVPVFEPEHLAPTVRWWLDHPEEAARIAANATAWVRERLSRDSALEDTFGVLARSTGAPSR